VPNVFRIVYYLAGALRRARWKPERLRLYQEKRLRAVVRYAFDNVPFYHRKFREAGVHPDDVKCLEDLKKLPVVKSEEFRRVPPNERVSVECDVKKLRVVKTSGSSGMPLKIFLNRAEDDWRKAIYMRANILCGQKPRDRWVAITAPHHFGDVTGLQRRLGVFAQVCLSVFDDVDEHIDFLCKFKPDILDGYSSALLLLAREVDRRGLDVLKPKVVFGNADLVGLAERKYLEDVFEAPYCDQYGCAEFNRTAWNCLEREGYHMDVDSVITEFVDEDGNAVSPGECGEIVYTSLFNFAMPFIRYSIRDVGKPSNDECSCGVAMPLMEVIEGRKDSFIVLPNGKVVSPRTFTVAMGMFEHYEDIEQFRIIQKSFDYFDVLLKMKKVDLDEGDIAERLRLHFQKVLGVSAEDVTFNVSFVKKIPPSKGGKLSAVISEVARTV